MKYAMVGLLFASLAAAQPAPAQTEVAAPEEEGPAACRPGRAPLAGPVALGYGQADVATGRRGCPRTEVGLGGRGGLVIDTPDFYGAIGVDALLFGSRAFGPRAELFGTLELVHYQWVQNGTLKGSALSLGQATLGGSLVTHEGESTVGATSVRLLLPTSTASAHVRTVGVEVGHGVSLRVGEALEVHGHAGVDFSAGLSEARALPQVGLLGLVGAQYAPFSWFALALDAHARAGATTYVAPALALRFFGGPVTGELASSLPLAGSDRHDGLVMLRLAYRFD